MRWTGASARPARNQAPPSDAAHAGERHHGNRAGQRPQFAPHVADVPADEHRQAADRDDHDLAARGRRCAPRRRAGTVAVRSGSERSMSGPARSTPRSRAGCGRPESRRSASEGSSTSKASPTPRSTDARDGDRARFELRVDGGEPRSPGHEAHGRADHADDDQRIAAYHSSSRTRSESAIDHVPVAAAGANHVGAELPPQRRDEDVDDVRERVLALVVDVIVDGRAGDDACLCACASSSRMAYPAPSGRRPCRPAARHGRRCPRRADPATSSLTGSGDARRMSARTRASSSVSANGLVM